MARVMWKASDGREFIIDTVKENLNTQEELLEHISKLRKEHGYEEPTFMSVHSAGTEGQAMVEGMDTVDVNELDDALRQKVEETIAEGLERPDPKRMN